MLNVSIALIPHICISFRKYKSFVFSILEYILHRLFILNTAVSGIRPSESWFDEKHLWGRQTLRLAVYRSPPLTVRVHHCLGCSSQKWQQRVTLKGPGVQLPENVTGLADRTPHRERGEDVTKTTTLKCYRSLFLSHTHTHRHVHIPFLHPSVT